MDEKQYLKFLPNTILPEDLKDMQVIVGAVVPPGGLDVKTLTHLMGRGAEHVQRIVLAGGQLDPVHCEFVRSQEDTLIEVRYHFRRREITFWLDMRSSVSFRPMSKGR